MQDVKFSYGVPAIDGRRADIVAPIGSTIDDMAKMLGPYVRAAWIVDFDGKMIRVPIDLWKRVKPKKDGVVFFDCRMGKKALSVVGVVAAIAATALTGGAGAFVAQFLGVTGLTASIVSGLTSTVIGFGVNLLANTLFASGSRSGASFLSGNDEAKNSYSRVDTDNNILGKDAYLPRVFGEARISPPDVVQPNSFVDRGAQAIERVLAIHGYNTVHNVYVDGTPVVDTVNLMPDALAFDDTGIWSRLAVDVTAGHASPDGSSDACKIISNTGSAQHRIRHLITSLPAGETITIEAYLKDAGYRYAGLMFLDHSASSNGVRIGVDLLDGSIFEQNVYNNAVLEAVSVESVGDGWFKVSLTGIPNQGSENTIRFEILSAPTASLGSWTGNGTDGTYVWNASVPQVREFPNVVSTVRQGAPNETTVVPVQRITKPVATSGDLVGFVVDDRLLEDQEAPENSSPTGYRFVVKSMKDASEMTIRMGLSGLADLKNTDNPVRIPLRIRYRPVGDKEGTWINLPEIHFTGIELGRRMFEIRIRRELQGFIGEDVSGVINHLFWREVPAVTAHTLADGSQNKTQWRAHPVFATGSGLQDVKNCFSVRHGVRVIVPDNKFMALQDYEFDITRGCAILDSDINDSYQVSGQVVSLFISRSEGGEWMVPVSQNNFQASLSILNAAMLRDNVHPVQKPGTTVICLQSRNQSIRNVTAHVTGMAKDWDGPDWGVGVEVGNKFTSPSDFSASVWNKTATTVSEGVTAPDGVSTADLLECTSTFNRLFEPAVALQAGVNYLSVYVKPDTDERYLRLRWVGYNPAPVFGYDLQTQEAVDGAGNPTDDAWIEDAGNGWYRCVCRVTLTGSDTVGEPSIYYATNSATSYNSVAGRRMNVWQAEVGPAAGWNTWTASRNPAVQTRQLIEDMLRYAGVAEYSTNPRIRALGQSALENTDWTGWRAQCKKMGASCSVVSSGQSFQETLLELLGAGLARPAFGDKLRIDYFRDRSAETPVLTFSPRNAESVSIIYENPRRPMGVRARFRDRNRGWQEREIEVRTPIYGNVQNWDGIVYENIDDPFWLEQRVTFDLLRAHHWRTRYEVTTALEGMALKPGTLVGLITDLVDDQSYGARVRDVLPDGRIALDNVLPTVTEQIFMDDIGVKFELSDILTTYDQAYALLTTPEGAELRAVTAVEGNIITPATLFGSVDITGAHIGIGPLSTRLKRCIVVEEQPSGEFAKTVTLADEAPEIYDFMKQTYGWSE